MAKKVEVKFVSVGMPIPLNQEDVMRLFGISRATLYRWRRDGLIIATKIGQKCFYNPEYIADLVAYPERQVPP